MAYQAIIGIATQYAGGLVKAGTRLKDAKDQGKELRYNADLIRTEARFESERIKAVTDTAAKEQTMAFLGSGVKVEGSALMVTAETYAEGTRQSDAVLRKADAEASSLEREAKRGVKMAKIGMAQAIFGVGG